MGSVFPDFWVLKNIQIRIRNKSSGFAKICSYKISLIHHYTMSEEKR